MELRILKPSFKYVPGQWLFIQIPDISRYQWHPVRRIILRFLLLNAETLTHSSQSLPPRKIRMFRCIFAKLVIGLVHLGNE